MKKSTFKTPDPTDVGNCNMRQALEFLYPAIDAIPIRMSLSYINIQVDDFGETVLTSADGFIIKRIYTKTRIPTGNYGLNYKYIKKILKAKKSDTYVEFLKVGVLVKNLSTKNTLLYEYTSPDDFPKHIEQFMDEQEYAGNSTPSFGLSFELIKKALRGAPSYGKHPVQNAVKISLHKREEDQPVMFRFYPHEIGQCVAVIFPIRLGW